MRRILASTKSDIGRLKKLVRGSKRMSWGELPGQLERFASTLRVEPGTKPTFEYMATQAGRFRASWKSQRTIEARRVPIPLPRSQGLHPVGTELQSCFLNLRFVAPEGDRPALCEFQVEVEGILEAGNSLVELQDHWRIDCEFGSSVAETSGLRDSGNGREPHPSYHFQRGGHAQDAFAAQDGFFLERTRHSGPDCGRASCNTLGQGSPYCHSIQSSRLISALRRMMVFCGGGSATFQSTILPSNGRKTDCGSHS